jgi:hypothetical protein
LCFLECLSIPCPFMPLKCVFLPYLKKTIKKRALFVARSLYFNIF